VYGCRVRDLTRQGAGIRLIRRPRAKIIIFAFHIPTSFCKGEMTRMRSQRRKCGLNLPY
jgi:hypothetical protein